MEEQKTEPLAGAARFKSAFTSFKDKNPLILFSGDIFAPSISKCIVLFFIYELKKKIKIFVIFIYAKETFYPFDLLVVSTLLNY